MSSLSIYSDQQPDHLILETQDAQKIASELKAIGVVFERWQPRTPLNRDADDVAVMQAYDTDINRIKSEQGYVTVDVLRVFPDNPKRVEIREKFLNEHTHDDDEVRFFVEGSGKFYLHLNNRVHIVTCIAGDFISVPANVRHWFDMGAEPHITAIRWFKIAEGWVPNFTGDNMSDKFPKHEPSAQAAA
jgi:1,2-dihydroxy-3-keto-5-methylthiopentene dioxygenase